MFLDYLRRVSHLRLFGAVSITRQTRDPPIEWNPDYEKQWREECTRRLTVSNDKPTDLQERYETPPVQTTNTEPSPPTTTARPLDCTDKAQACINAPKLCIYVRPTTYQKQQCDQAVVGTGSTLLFNTKHRFERLLNILSHPDSEIVHDNELVSQEDRARQSGKTAFLLELLKRMESLNKDLDIAILTDDHDTESVIYQILRFHGYQCQRIPVILDDNWSGEHGVFLTTSEASYTKWSTRPSIDVILMFDIRNSETILSKVDGEKRVLWIINKGTVEERAFSILQHESDAWQKIWQRNEALRNTMSETNVWNDPLPFHESVRISVCQALELLFPSNKRPRSPSDPTSIPSPKRKPSVIVLDSSDDEEIVIDDEQSVSQPPEPPLDVNHFEIRTTDVIDRLLDFPKVLDWSRKNKGVSKAATLSREFKETTTAKEKALYTTLQPRLEDIESKFQHDYIALTDTLQRQYTEFMYMYQQKYRKEALNALDIAVANRDKQQPQLD